MSENKTSINPQRLKYHLDTFGISLEQLAKKSSIALNTLQRAMQKEMVISVKQLEKLSQFFNRSLLFFIEPTDIDQAQLYSPQFRTINNKKPIKDIKLAKLIENIEKQREVFLYLKEDLQIPIDNQLPQFDKQKTSLEAYAQAIRDVLKLDNKKNNFDSLRQAIENKDIMVILSSGYNGRWQIDKNNPVVGFSLYYETLPVIVIKKQASKERQSFTLLHELAHLLLHKESEIDEQNYIENYEKKEREANEFAGKILIPDHFLQEIDIEQIKQSEPERIDPYLDEFKKKWGASKEAILVRLSQSNKIKYEVYKKYKSYKENQSLSENQKKPNIPRQYRHREPLHLFGANYVNTVFEAFNNNHITLAKASSYLDNLKIDKIRKLQNGL